MCASSLEDFWRKKKKSPHSYFEFSKATVVCLVDIQLMLVERIPYNKMLKGNRP